MEGGENSTAKESTIGPCPVAVFGADELEGATLCQKVVRPDGAGGDFKKVRVALEIDAESQGASDYQTIPLVSGDLVIGSVKIQKMWNTCLAESFSRGSPVQLHGAVLRGDPSRVLVFQICHPNAENDRIPDFKKKESCPVFTNWSGERIES